MGLINSFKNIFSNNQSSGVILIFCVFISLIIANSSAAGSFQNILDTEIGTHFFHLNYSVSVWINDGLMSVFFLLVGLEIKKEIMGGELSSFRNASLPIFAAVGGMLVPAVVFSIFNSGTIYGNGWGIPMATDIAFSLAIISMLGNAVPNSIKVFLAALAIVDDLGAILVIAVFYTEQIHWIYLLLSFGIAVLLFILNFLKITKLVFYLVPGIFLWYFLHHSGIHATIAGVLLAFSIPSNILDGTISPGEKLEHALHLPVGFIIMPVFALANTNITFNGSMAGKLLDPLGLGIILGLVFGKLIGINLFSMLAIRLKISVLPKDSSWFHMIGVGLLAGIGFTMSIFIALLSFKGQIEIQDEAKFAILVASVLSATMGYTVLRLNKK